MDEILFEAAFCGQIHDDARLDEVKAEIARMFKADEATIARLFSGKRIVVKKNLTAAEADKYSIAFTRAGAICELEPMPEDATAPAPADDGTATKAPSSASVAAADTAASNNRGPGKAATISIVAALLVVAALVAATPYAMGMLAEQKYRDGMTIFQDFAQQQSGAFDVKSDVDYQRGWLSSTAVNTITLELPERAPVKLVLNSNISHGPMLFGGANKFGLASLETNMPLSETQRADMARIWKGNDNPIQIRSHMDYAGKTLTEVSIAGFTIDNLDSNPGSKLNFEPLLTTVTLSEQFTRADADMSWDGMELDTAEAKVVVGKFTGRSKKQLSPEGLWLGDDELRMSRVSVDVISASASGADVSGQMPFSSTIEKIEMFAHSEVDNSNLVNGHTTIAVNNIVIENKSVASDVKLTLVIERLQAKALQVIAKKLSAHQKYSMQSGSPGRTPDFALIRAEVTEILAAGPILKITTLQAATEHGKVDADLEATIKVDDPETLQNPMLLLFAMRATGNASAPARLIEGTPAAALVPGLIEQGYINSENGQLRTTIKFRQGQLTLNGKALQQ